MREGKIDWKEVRRRIDAAGEFLERGARPSGPERLKALKKRAEALARAPEEEGAEDKIEAVEFSLAGERYAFASGYIREIIPVSELTPVPCTPAFVAGIINVRGEIRSVIDLKKFFDLPDGGLTDLNKVLILSSSGSGMEFGVLADEILGVRWIPAGGLKTLPTLTGIREEYLLGVTADRTTVLDAGRLLDDRSIAVNEKTD